MKKRVGISSKTIEVYDLPLHEGCMAFYPNVIERAGGIPFIIPFIGDLNTTDAIVENIDVLLLTGGCDIHPSNYGEEPNPKLENPCLDRDKIEIALIEAAVKKGIPIFGICRGMQLLNVYFGGSLYQDVFSQTKNPIGHLNTSADDFIHSIELVPGKFLEKIYDDEKLLVNSIHHQGIKKLADVFEEAAVAPDGIVEAIQCEEKNIYGVQFHPEQLAVKEEKFLEIFKFILNL